MSPVKVPRPIQARPRPRTMLESGPWLGVREADEHVASRDPRFVVRVLNSIPDRRGGGFRQRLGWRAAPATVQIGGATNPVQRVDTWSISDGTHRTLAFADGKVWEATWTSAPGVEISGWTERLNSTDFTTPAITLSATARIYLVVMNDKLIVSDGVNTPWMWDGTAHGGLTKLTNCPVLYGQPTIHYAVLVGIKNTNRRQITWSNINDPTTGYEVGFTNVWDLRQTSGAPLSAIRGTNHALYVWRDRSITAVYGAVDDEWTSAGTLEGVSGTVGTRSPDAVEVFEDMIVFLDADARPRVLRIGGGLLDFRHEDASFTISGLIAIENASVTIDPYDRLALFGVNDNPAAGGTRKTKVLVLDMERGTFAGAWTGSRDFESIDFIIDPENIARIALGATNGYVFTQGTRAANRETVTHWMDQTEGAIPTQSLVLFTVASPYLGHGLPGLKQADMVYLRGNWSSNFLVFLQSSLAAGPHGATVTTTPMHPEGELAFGLGPIMARRIMAILVSSEINASTVPQRVDGIRLPVWVMPDDPRVRTGAIP